MPRRDDLETILLIGSGPIVIGQGCEFDYSGTQAVRALREEGYRVVLVNSNPATIMTDPDLADRTYIEPISAEWVERIIERESPDALLPTMGGQTALNVALQLHDSGVLERHGVELIGADARAIRMAEDREEFAEAIARLGLEVPHGGFAKDLEDALEIIEEVGYPAIIRPSFTLGGTGGGIAYNLEEFKEQVRRGIDLSPVGEVLIDRSVIGWKEFEFEIIRDAADEVIVVCTIENFDPMGVHTGDSITVAPAQTLKPAEYERMRAAAEAIVREIDLAAGGCNIQFALDPESGELLVVEMNPRVSRSSALASKATGYPIARIAAKLAVGYHLSELRDEISGRSAADEPAMDHIVTKFPRFTFEKFPSVDPTLGVQMKAVGEVMAIGKSFQESWQKAIRGLEIDRTGWEIGAEPEDDGLRDDSSETLQSALRRPTPERVFQIKRAFELGFGVREIAELTKIDPWFLERLHELVVAELWYSGQSEVGRPELGRMKELGFSDAQLARLRGQTEAEVRAERWRLGLRPRYERVDTSAGGYEKRTAYLYSTYAGWMVQPAETGEPLSDLSPDEGGATERIMILGSGPNRIGQGIEFDYCCVQAALALEEDGFETIMVNSNPETVSTDFDISDKLYFEPLTLEDVLEIVERERPKGVIVQLGGQTPLKLAGPLSELGVPILGTSVDAIDRAEDRDRFLAVCREIGAAVPPNGIAMSTEQAVRVAQEVGYPVLVRPSYVLGGRAMEIVYDEESLLGYFERAVRAAPDHPVLIDRFLEDAFEVDVDAVADGERVAIAGVMQHIEYAGVHSGDSASVLPPYLLKDTEIEEIHRLTARFAEELGVVGLINIQFAIKGDTVYVLEVNPRASRTVPFVSKATGSALARYAARVMAGKSLDELGVDDETEFIVPGVAVKDAVFPFNRFDVDVILGPEMRSTGEVMGFDESFGMAYAKARLSAGAGLPTEGTLVVTVNDADKPLVTPILRRFHDLGFQILATEGTHRYLRARGVPSERVFKVGEGRPNIVDHIISGKIQLLINTPLGKKSQYDDYAMRRAAIAYRIPYCTTYSAVSAACDAVIALRSRRREVMSLQERIAATS